MSSGLANVPSQSWPEFFGLAGSAMWEGVKDGHIVSNPNRYTLSGCAAHQKLHQIGKRPDRMPKQTALTWQYRP